MLHITNGNVTLRVTRGAFNSFYKKHGFHTVDDEGAAEESEVVVTQPSSGKECLEDSTHREKGAAETDEDDSPEDCEEEDEDLSQIPLGEMSFDQLCEYADQLDLDRDGIRSKKELRALIREHLNN